MRHSWIIVTMLSLGASGAWAGGAQAEAARSAASQRPPFEVFDVGGMPASPRTAVERDLARRIRGHRRGDLAGAARIQRDLAVYYRSQGDSPRARAAEERAEAAEAAYGKAPEVAVYQPETPGAKPEAEAPALGIPAIEPLTDVPAAEAAQPEPAGEEPLQGAFHVLQGRTLHRWEFRPDGTFEHGWMVRGSRGAVGMETGTFSVSGPFITLFVERRAGVPAHSRRRLRLERRGPRGLMLDGTLLRPGLP